MTPGLTKLLLSLVTVASLCAFLLSLFITGDPHSAGLHAGVMEPHAGIVMIAFGAMLSVVRLVSSTEPAAGGSPAG